MSELIESALSNSAVEASASRRAFMQGCLAALVATTARPSRGAPAAAGRASGQLVKPNDAKRLRDFSFFHFSDTHIDPRLEGQPFNPRGRSVEALGWIAENSSQRIAQERYDIATESPHFAIHTGDVFEYSVIDETWSDWEGVVSRFSCPIAPVPGNHDNTWGEINRELRSHFGDDSYSFDYAGCHFVCLNSAGLLDPLPAWDRRTLNWLERDLARVDRDQPVFLAMHHPLSGNAGYASEFDKLRLWKVIQNHNVVLVMDGHWHTVHHQTWQGLDRVNGGSTFGVHTGYNSVTLRDNVLRVVFHYWQENDARPRDRDQAPLVEKQLPRRRILRPFKASPVVREVVPFGKSVRTQIQIEEEFEASASAWIDGSAKSPVSLERKGARHVALLATEQLSPGWHYVTLRVQTGNQPAVDFAESFWLDPPADAPYTVYRHQGAAGIKTLPLVAGEAVLVGDTAGVVSAFTLDLKPRWTHATGSQIVHCLAVFDQMVVVGDVDGGVHALELSTGKPIWTRKLQRAIYAAGAMVGDRVVMADAGGWLHALGLNDGKPAWSAKVAAFGIESRPVAYNGMLYAGAWDGQLYAVNAADGGVAWKAWCPSWHADLKSRYYAPADSPPAVVNDHLFVTDRGYNLGRYTLEGKFVGAVRGQVAAIAANERGDGFYSRGLDNKLVKHGPDGTEIWSLAARLGRAPTSPVVFGDRVAVVSDTGELCVADADSGKLEFTLSISPSLFVLSGLGSDGAERLYAADMDGRLTGVRLT